MRIVFLMVFCLVSLDLPSQQDPGSATDRESSYTERDEKDFNFYPGGRVTIQTEVPGNIRIVGWKKSSVCVEIEKIVHGRTAENARSLIEGHPVHVRYNQTTATVQIKGVPSEAGLLTYNLTVSVPGDKTDIRATIPAGNISVESVNGWIEVGTGMGNIAASRLSGYFSGITQNGNVLAEMFGKRWDGLEFGAVTRSGCIDLRLNADYSAALQLETRNGKIFVDYPPQIVEGEPVPLTVGIRKKVQTLNSSVGDGGAPIKLVSHQGDIRLSLNE